MRSITRAAAALALILLFPAVASAGEHRLGFGYHYWETLDNIDLGSLGNLDDNGSAAVFSYQYLPGGLARFELDLEYSSSGFGGSTDTSYSPQAFILVGRLFYGGVGIGATKSDGFPSGDSWSDVWYAGRIGVEFLLLPKIHLDINANYRAKAFQDLNQAKTDAMTLGASIRVGF